MWCRPGLLSGRCSFSEEGGELLDHLVKQVVVVLQTDAPARMEGNGLFNMQSLFTVIWLRKDGRKWFI